MDTETTETTVFEPTADSILQGLPTNHKEYTPEQLKTLMSREDVARIQAIGKPATTRINKEIADAVAANNAAPTAPKFTAGDSELLPKDCKVLVEEMNFVMALHPKIDVGATDCLERIRAELKDLRIEDFVRKEGDTESPVFSPAAGGLIRKLGFDIPGETEKVKGAKASKAKATAKAPVTEGKTAVAKEEAGKIATPEDGKKTAVRTPGASRQGKPGVISMIQELITDKAMSHDEVLAALVKKYPDRRAEGMQITVRAMMPSAFLRKGVKCEKIMVGDVKKFQIVG
jgi:hypothetical protein